MDLFRELGPLAFASRLRRLSDRIMTDINRVFRDEHYDFQARWSPLVYLLKEESPLSISDITERLGMTHPYIIRISGEMMENGFLLSSNDKRDNRRRFVRLSAKGKRLVPKLEEHWRKAAVCQRKLIEASKIDVIKAISTIEDELEKESMYHRLTTFGDNESHQK